MRSEGLVRPSVCVVTMLSATTRKQRAIVNATLARLKKGDFQKNTAF